MYGLRGRTTNSCTVRHAAGRRLPGRPEWDGRVGIQCSSQLSYRARARAGFEPATVGGSACRPDAAGTSWEPSFISCASFEAPPWTVSVRPTKQKAFRFRPEGLGAAVVAPRTYV